MLVVKNGHQKETCYDEVGLCAQNRKHVIVGFVGNQNFIML